MSKNTNNKRKRAVVLALIVFFCGATAFVSVDWKRFGGGFLAFFNPKSEPMPAHASGGTPAGGGSLGSTGGSHAGAASLPRLVALGARRHANSIGGGSGGHKPDEDLFKYGDPAAGGIPPDSFLVARNDTAGNGNGGAGVPAPVGDSAAPDTDVNPGSGGSGSSGVGSPAPAPGGIGGTGDGGIVFPTPTSAPPPAPTPPVSAPPPVVSPPTSTPPAPTPTQSGTSDQNPGSGGGDLPPVTGGGDLPPVSGGGNLPPVSAVPEASDAAMMGLGALFLAVAATRRRKNDQA